LVAVEVSNRDGLDARIPKEGRCGLEVILTKGRRIEPRFRFLDYPQLELSNNLAENAIQPLALGRKNWIHIGSEQAGPRVAVIVSIVESCGRLDISLREYLGSVLPGLANRPISQLAELTPAAWANGKMSATPPTSSAT
jgi:hypothetical protein